MLDTAKRLNVVDCCTVPGRLEEFIALGLGLQKYVTDAYSFHTFHYADTKYLHWLRSSLTLDPLSTFSFLLLTTLPTFRMS